MADTASSSGAIVAPDKKIFPGIPAEVLATAFPYKTVSPQVIAAAAMIVREIKAYNSFILLPNNERPYSRVVESYLSYYAITGDRLDDVIKIIANMGYARGFFKLAIPRNDSGLKQYLLDNGVLWDTILYYHDFDVWDAGSFAFGFTMGVGASFAAILEVIKDLLGFTVDAFINPREAWDKVGKFFAGIKELRAEALIEMPAAEWHKINLEFSDHLMNLRFDKAGYVLGKLAGDLWQLLTGLGALAKLPGMTIKLAKKFAVLFTDGVRLAKNAAVLLLELLSKVGAAIADAIEIGLGAVANFFEDAALLAERLRKGAMVIVKEGMMIFNIPERGLVVDGFGFLPEGMLFAETSEGTTTIVARVRVEFQKGLKYVEDLKASTARQVRKIPNKLKFIREVKEIEKRAYELVKEWRDTLQKILTENKIPLNPREIGTWIHKNLEHAFDDLAASVKKVYSSVSEIQIRQLAKQLAQDKAELKLFLARANEPLLDFAKKRPEMLAALGVSDEKELAKLLKKLGYEDPAKTLIGDLISDGVLFNEDTKQLISVDWTSGLGKYRFANEFEAALKAGEALSDAEKLELAQKFLRHTFREYALREAILEYIFESWETKVIEIMYDPFKLVKP